MKKLFVLLSIILLLVSGCSIKTLSNTDYKKNINIILSEKSSSTNVNFEGYKYYVPNGLKFLNKEEYNAVLKDKYNNYYYTYFDLVSYYHKVENTYEEKSDAYYSKLLAYNNKNGYIEISETNNKYFIVYVFNYAKIEALVTKDSLTDSINNMSYILRSVKYNDKVLGSIIGDNVLSYSEENFTLFDTESSQEDFLEVVSKYDSGYKEAKDQEELNLDE